MNLSDLAKGMEIRNFKMGEVIFREQGFGGQEMFFIFSGEVKIYKKMGSSNEEINHLLAGAFFGEIGLIQNVPRTASAIVCSQQAKIGVISRNQFIIIAKENPQFLVHLFRKLQERIMHREEFRDLLDIQELELDALL
ncbi:MAG: cyclic nucleotide-binding domain-containing protein [Leptospira sp.]|nr:cyclic nucleotide-binding domain-containing protein [Leptospira sp.]